MISADPATTLALTGLGQKFRHFDFRMDKQMKKILLVAGAALALRDVVRKVILRKRSMPRLGRPILLLAG